MIILFYFVFDSKKLWTKKKNLVILEKKMMIDDYSHKPEVISHLKLKTEPFLLVA